MALRIDDEFAVFLGKRSFLGQRQNIEHRFRRAAELHPPQGVTTIGRFIRIG